MSSRQWHSQPTRKTVAVAAIAAACILGSLALAADLLKEGTCTDFVSGYSGTSNPMPFSKTHSAELSEITGTSQSNPPGGSFDKVAFRCITLGYSADGKNTATTNYCSSTPSGEQLSGAPRTAGSAACLQTLGW